VELKDSYYRQAVRNCVMAAQEQRDGARQIEIFAPTVRPGDGSMDDAEDAAP
jgi:hypothetical protein